MPEPPMMPSTALVIAAIPENEGPQTGPSRQAICAASDRGLLRILSVRHLARLFDLVPDLLLGEVQQTRQHDQEDDDLEADALARHHVRLGRPLQEGGDVL